MASEIGIIGRCMRARYVDPCKSLTYQVKARGIQRASITMPMARRMFDVRLVNFIVLQVYQRSRLTLATQSSNGYTFSEDYAEIATAST
jgi:hypothetical protein